MDGRIAAAGLRASFLVGNDTDEYLSRDAADSEQLSRDETEFKNGHRHGHLQDAAVKVAGAIVGCCVAGVVLRFWNRATTA